MIKPDGTVVGHIPKHASKAVLFSQENSFTGMLGNVTDHHSICEVTGRGRPWTENSVQLQVLWTSRLHVRRQAPNSLIVAVQTTFYTDRC